MGFGQAVKTCFSKYVDFHGRAPRSEYWYFVLFYALVMLATAVAGFLLGGTRLVIVGPILVLLAIFLPSLAVQVRRLHDTNAAGWWILLAFIPYLGGLIMIVWYCIKGTAGENRFGPDPLQPVAMDAFD
jgi:uncharacterized membrane protein YhaH (DUF805 family)